MPETTLEFVKRHLDAERQSEKLQALPNDFYLKSAAYAQLLRRSMVAGNSEITNRLIIRQSKLLETMARRLLTLRSGKAANQKAVSQLLPEERQVCAIEQSFAGRFESFVESVSSGQVSQIELARTVEMTRSTTVRFLKHVNELVGLDLRRYGPFEPEDLASIPAANADLLVANGEAALVSVKEP